MSTRLILAVGLVAVASLAGAAEEGTTILDGGWRVSVGGVYNSPVRAKMRMRPSALSSGLPTVVGQFRAEAERKARGTQNGTRTIYPNGAWIDTSDAHEVVGTTWNAKLPAGTRFDNQSFVLASESYDEIVTVDGMDDPSFADDRPMPGASIDVSRNLYHNEEWKAGLDFCLGFMYFFRTDIFSTGDGYGTVRRRGTYETTVESPGDVNDPWSWNADGTYGAGTYEGPGPVFDLGTLSTSHTSFTTPASSLRADGDYEEFEIQFLLRPYYDVADWFRLYATAGLVVSRGEFDLDVFVSENGAAFRRSREYAEWDVYGVAGLGGMFRYRDFTLSVDFLARFLDDDIDVNDRYVQGHIERGDWLLKVALGYEF